MKSAKSPKNIARRNLHITAIASTFLSVMLLFFSVREYALGAHPMPNRVTPELYQSLREIVMIMDFGVMPVFGFCFLVIAISIWFELRRLRKAESESDKQA
jgi:hypothetical protein